MSHDRYVLSEKYNPYQANSKASSENVFRGGTEMEHWPEMNETKSQSLIEIQQ